MLSATREHLLIDAWNETTEQKNNKLNPRLSRLIACHLMTAQSLDKALMDDPNAGGRHSGSDSLGHWRHNMNTEGYPVALH